jgi:hypothetical protein
MLAVIAVLLFLILLALPMGQRIIGVTLAAGALAITAPIIWLACLIWAARWVLVIVGLWSLVLFLR